MLITKSYFVLFFKKNKQEKKLRNKYTNYNLEITKQQKKMLYYIHEYYNKTDK